MEATPGFEPGNEGFADPCLTTWLCRHVRGQSTILFPHKHMRTSSPVFSQGPGQRQLLSKIKGAYLAPIKNGAGDGARTRFPVSRERRPPFAGALPDLPFHGPSALGGGSGSTAPGGRIPAVDLCSDKKWSGRRGSNPLPPPWQGGALPDELRPHMTAQSPDWTVVGASGRNRTNDTRIFSPLLYQLSYRGVSGTVRTLF